MGRIGSINREILKLALPSILANITVPLVGMVDIAVAGHIHVSGGFTNAALIGGIAIGTMLFDLLYWNFGFLRISTGGLTAQAYGRADFRSCANTLVRSVGLALGVALVMIAIQWLFIQAAFLVVKSSPEVKQLAQQYFYIRIWAAPATLSLMAFKGWFIGMQDSISAMVTDLVVNCVNILASVFLSLGTAWLGGSWEGLGFAGVAYGTLTAQYSGLTCACVLLMVKYWKRLFAGLKLRDVKESFKAEDTAKFFSMNGDVFVRSLCFIAIYIGFTMISARFGDVLLAVSAIMMKLLMIFSYFTDGFAYASEAMVGKYIGAKDRDSLSLSVKWNLVWCAGLAVLFMLVYGLGGTPMLRMMTSDATVVDAARQYIPWLLLMPVAGVGAFALDGIYVGATQTPYIKRCMLWAVVAFFGVWFGGLIFTGGLHLLMAAYFAHLLARTVVLAVNFKAAVFKSFR